MLRKKTAFIDDEAQEETPTDDQEEDSDLDDISVTTDVAAAEDEDFIVEVVGRRFGLKQLNSVTGFSEDKSLQAQSTSLVGLRQQCSVGYNSDCSKPRDKSGGSELSVQPSDIKSSVVIGGGYSGPSTTPSGSRRKKLPKTTQQSVVPSSISERARSAQLKAKVLPISPQALQANAVSSGVQASAMDVEKTEAV